MPKVSQLRRENPQKIKSDLNLALTNSFISICCGYIRDVEVKIHRVNLSGESFSPTYDYNFFSGLIGNIGVNKDFKPEERMPNYRMQLVSKQDSFNLNIFIYPLMLHFPSFVIEVIPINNVVIKDFIDFFECLDGIIPNIKVSSVEYTIDMICYEQYQVSNLFSILMRHLYIRNCKGTRLNGELRANWDKKIRMNSVYQNENTKLYERGCDDDKNGDGWYSDKFDRVRFEHKADRKELKNHGINSIKEFISDCKFLEITCAYISFKCFKKTRKYPNYWDYPGYEAVDIHGNNGVFQNELVYQRKSCKHIMQKIENIAVFNPLKERLLGAITSFDTAWKKTSIV